MIDGILNVYKEQDYTSFDVVAKLRGILKQKKIGHTGTLDPMAEGVLLVCLGKATKLVDLLTEGDKCYRATMKLGYETDTEDVTGETTAEGDAAVLAQLTQADVERAILSFVGKYDQIPPMYSAIKKDGKKRLKVGIVGEIYVKYAALGNNNLEKFLRSEDCEVNLPGMMNFILFKIDNRIIDCDLYGGHRLKRFACKILFDYCTKIQNMFNDAIKNNSDLEVPSTYQHVKDLTQGVNGMGNRMGEGWLLTGEMLELADTGYENIVCTQPFGCLPNHISGKGMIRKVREKMPNANIVAVDYDAGAPKVNQENRIKLMLSIGKEKLEEE